MDQVLPKKMRLKQFLEMATDLAVLVELGRSFHQQRTVKVKVRERDFVPL